MTALRPRSLPTHGALELLIGLALMLAPFPLGLGAAATVVSVVAGVIVVGLALNAGIAGLAPVAVAAQRAYDTGAAVGIGGAALIVALAGDGAAGAFLGAAALAQLMLVATTRYAAP